jgi:hypothetical protein
MVGPPRLELDLYRVKVKQPLQDQQRWLQVVDSVFDGMGQKRPVGRTLGHKGPKSSGALPSIPSALGKCIRHARQGLGCTVEALATASGLPVEYIEAVETGRGGVVHQGAGDYLRSSWSLRCDPLFVHRNVLSLLIERDHSD